MSYTFLTIKVPESLRWQLKKQALREEKTMAAIVQEVLSQHLNQFTASEPLLEPVQHDA